MNPLGNYAEQFKANLAKYESLIQEQNHLTKEYIQERKEKFKDLEDHLNEELKKLQNMTPIEAYIGTMNMSIPKLYWDTYLLWLGKVKSMYELDSDYFKNVVSLTTPVLKENPFLKPYTIFDAYQHFNMFRPKN